MIDSSRISENGMSSKFIKFVLVGAFATLVQYFLLILLVELIDFDAVFSSLGAYLFSGVINYALNYRFTFRRRSSHSRPASRFVLLVLVGASMNAGLMYILIEQAKVYYLFSQLLTTAFVLIFNFFLSNYWVFTEGSGDD